jgi:HSP20 family protein
MVPANRSLTTIFDDLMRPFDELMGQPFPSSMRSIWSEFDSRQPRLDVQDRGDHFTLTAELPGFAKEDVEVRLHANSLELKAQKKSESEGKEKDGVHKSRSYAYFHRYLSLPDEVVADKVDGSMKNGILELKLPKKQRAKLEKGRTIDLK